MLHKRAALDMTTPQPFPQRVPPLLVLVHRACLRAKKDELEEIEERWACRNRHVFKERVAEVCTRFDTMLEPVHTAVKQKSKGWVQCVGPLSRLSDYEYRWSGEYSDSQGDDLKELGTCGALFFPVSGRLTRRRPPHIAFPESTLAGSSRGKMTLPDEFCVCDARADLCPSCLPNRKACELCSESFCRHCAPVHRRKCKEAHRDMCRVCRLDVGQSELHRCATDFGYGLRCATLACASCLERCDGEVFEARITAEPHSDIACAT